MRIDPTLHGCCTMAACDRRSILASHPDMRGFILVVYICCVIYNGAQVEFGDIAYSKLRLSPCYNP